MKKLPILAVILVLVGLVILGGCIPPPSVEIKVLRPAEIDIGYVKTIGISPFRGQGGDAVTNRLTAKLFEGGLFTILERQRINALINEMGLAEIGIVDQSRAAQLGKALGAEAIVFGSVDGYVAEDFRGRERVTKRRKTGRKVKDIFGRMVDETESYEVILPYTMRQARLAVTFKMVNVETTELLAIKSITKEYRQKVVHDPDRPGELRAKGIILDELVDQATDEFVKLVSPHYVIEKKIWENIDVEEGKAAFNYFKNGLYPETGEILDRLMRYPTLETYQLAAVYYDRGLIYEILGNLNKAEELYKEAAVLESSDLHLKALKNIREKIEDVKKLQEQQL